MALFGSVLLIVAFASAILSVILFWVGHAISSRDREELGDRLTSVGYYLTMLTFVALSGAVALLVYCFMAGNYSIAYVAQQHSTATGSLAWLYKLSGVWSGRAGSLMLWTWLISLFAAIIAYRRVTISDKLSNIASSVMQLVLIAFMGVLIFSVENSPFIATAAQYLASDGSLVNAPSGWGMNILLEHWAMAIHPVTLFVGYAGLTVPFAYAVSALVNKDFSKEWVKLCQGYAILAWIFLGIGIGLGAVWAYTVLGWGGYWAWDPVENASLLPWLVGVALMHTFTLYRRQGSFKKWAIFCACLTFAFVVLGTFITRSGLVESVHAFEGDPVSFWFFIILIIMSLLVGIAGLFWRRKDFASDVQITSFTGREAAYYFNNVIMVVCACLIAYLTVASALPSWLPYGGQTVTAGTYDTIARIVGVFYFLLMAVCPMLSWHKTLGRDFWRKALIPGICGLVLFALLMACFIFQLLPSYNAIIAGGGTAADDLISQGPSWYYNGVAVLGLLVASLLLFNSIFLFCRDVKKRAASTDASLGAGLIGHLRGNASRAGGVIVHAGMGIMLIGLIGSNMYVTEITPYLNPGDSVQIQEYTVEFNQTKSGTDGSLLVYGAQVTLYKNGQLLASTIPNIEISLTEQRKSNAAIFSMPLCDVFVAYQGTSTNGQCSFDIRLNPLINFVWLGLTITIIGSALGLLLRNSNTRRKTADYGKSYTRASDDAASISGVFRGVSDETASQQVADLQTHIAELEAQIENLEKITQQPDDTTDNKS